jgi:hypothetical protein
VARSPGAWHTFETATYGLVGEATDMFSTGRRSGHAVVAGTALAMADGAST